MSEIPNDSSPYPHCDRTPISPKEEFRRCRSAQSPNPNLIKVPIPEIIQEPFGQGAMDPRIRVPIPEVLQEPSGQGPVDPLIL